MKSFEENFVLSVFGAIFDENAIFKIQVHFIVDF
jgi:hypothetical protein